MNLCLDFGNSLQKYAVFESAEIIARKTKKKISINDLQEVYQTFSIRRTILASVIDTPHEILSFLEQQPNFKLLSSKLKLPLKIAVDYPEKVGSDLLAAATGAWSMKPDAPCLIIQAGTCITHQWVQNGVYEGGSISPGVAMRFKALSNFTAKLPEISKQPVEQITGKNTEQAILSGVIYGVAAEINALIQYYKNLDVNTLCFICGGDAIFLENYINFPIFANSNLVFKGLNYILNYQFENS